MWAVINEFRNALVSDSRGFMASRAKPLLSKGI